MDSFDGQQQPGSATLNFKLPALNRYIKEITGEKPTSHVTEYLAEKLYPFGDPNRLPDSVASFYAGPTSKGYQYIPQEVPPPPPNHPPGMDRVMSPVRAAIHAKAPILPAPQISSKLTKGLQVETDPNRIRSGRIGKLQRGGNSAGSGASTLSKSMPDFKSTLAGISDLTKPKGAEDPGASQATATAPRTSVMNRILQARKSDGAAIQVPGPTKFAADIKKMLDKVKTGGAGTGPGGKPAVNRYRSLRVQNTEKKEQIYTQVTPPVMPQQMFTTTSKSGRDILHSVLEKEGHTKTIMRRIVDQLAEFNELADDLKQALADQFTLYSYSPDYKLYAKGTVCEEVHVVLSGKVLVLQEYQAPERLQAGTVLGLGLMLKRQQVPLDVVTDPHFACHLATLSWAQYEATLKGWAAQKVGSLVYELQPSLAKQLSASIQANAKYVQHEMGDALYVQDTTAEGLVLLVKGQVLVTCTAPADMLQTESQIVTQLRLTMGDTSVLVPSDIPKLKEAAMAAAAMGGIRRRGGLKISTDGAASQRESTSGASDGGSESGRRRGGIKFGGDDDAKETKPGSGGSLTRIQGTLEAIDEHPDGETESRAASRAASVHGDSRPGSAKSSKSAASAPRKAGFAAAASSDSEDEPPAAPKRTSSGSGSFRRPSLAEPDSSDVPAKKQSGARFSGAGEDDEEADGARVGSRGSSRSSSARFAEPEGPGGVNSRGSSRSGPRFADVDGPRPGSGASARSGSRGGLKFGGIEEEEEEEQERVGSPAASAVSVRSDGSRRSGARFSLRTVGEEQEEEADAAAGADPDLDPESKPPGSARSARSHGSQRSHRTSPRFSVDDDNDHDGGEGNTTQPGPADEDGDEGAAASKPGSQASSRKVRARAVSEGFGLADEAEDGRKVHSVPGSRASSRQSSSKRGGVHLPEPAAAAAADPDPDPDHAQQQAADERDAEGAGRDVHRGRSSSRSSPRSGKRSGSRGSSRRSRSPSKAEGLGDTDPGTEADDDGEREDGTPEGEGGATASRQGSPAGSQRSRKSGAKPPGSGTTSKRASSVGHGSVLHDADQEDAGGAAGSPPAGSSPARSRQSTPLGKAGAGARDEDAAGDKGPEGVDEDAASAGGGKSPRPGSQQSSKMGGSRAASKPASKASSRRPSITDGDVAADPESNQDPDSKEDPDAAEPSGHEGHEGEASPAGTAPHSARSKAGSRPASVAGSKAGSSPRSGSKGSPTKNDEEAGEGADDAGAEDRALEEGGADLLPGSAGASRRTTPDRSARSAADGEDGAVQSPRSARSVKSVASAKSAAASVAASHHSAEHQADGEGQEAEEAGEGAELPEPKDSSEGSSPRFALPATSGTRSGRRHTTTGGNIGSESAKQRADAGLRPSSVGAVNSGADGFEGVSLQRPYTSPQHSTLALSRRNRQAVADADVKGLEGMEPPRTSSPGSRSRSSRATPAEDAEGDEVGSAAGADEGAEEGEGKGDEERPSSPPRQRSLRNKLIEPAAKYDKPLGHPEGKQRRLSGSGPQPVPSKAAAAAAAGARAHAKSDTEGLTPPASTAGEDAAEVKEEESEEEPTPVLNAAKIKDVDTPPRSAGSGSKSFDPSKLKEPGIRRSPRFGGDDDDDDDRSAKVKEDEGPSFRPASKEGIGSIDGSKIRELLKSGSSARSSVKSAGSPRVGSSRAAAGAGKVGDDDDDDEDEGASGAGSRPVSTSLAERIKERELQRLQSQQGSRDSSRTSSMRRDSMTADSAATGATAASGLTGMTVTTEKDDVRSTISEIGSLPVVPAIRAMKESMFGERRSVPPSTAGDADANKKPAGTPLYNVLAATIKANKQQIAAVYSNPCFFGQNCLQAGNTHAHLHTALAMQPTQVIFIPRQLILRTVTQQLLPSMIHRMALQQQKAGAVGSEGSKGRKTWPEAADSLREYLRFSPAGSRPAWQVEALADAFSTIPMFARLPWQTRLKMFQDLHFTTVSVKGLDLAKFIITLEYADSEEDEESEIQAGVEEILDSDLEAAMASRQSADPFASEVEEGLDSSRGPANGGNEWRRPSEETGQLMSLLGMPEDAGSRPGSVHSGSQKSGGVDLGADGDLGAPTPKLFTTENPSNTGFGSAQGSPHESHADPAGESILQRVDSAHLTRLQSDVSQFSAAASSAQPTPRRNPSDPNAPVTQDPNADPADPGAQAADGSEEPVTPVAGLIQQQQQQQQHKHRLAAMQLGQGKSPATPSDISSRPLSPWGTGTEANADQQQAHPDLFAGQTDASTAADGTPRAGEGQGAEGDPAAAAGLSREPSAAPVIDPRYANYDVERPPQAAVPPLPLEPKQEAASPTPSRSPQPSTRTSSPSAADATRPSEGAPAPAPAKAPSPKPPKPRPPPEVKSVGFKTDDKLYIIVSGAIRVESQLKVEEEDRQQFADILTSAFAAENAAAAAAAHAAASASASPPDAVAPGGAEGGSKEGAAPGEAGSGPQHPQDGGAGSAGAGVAALTPRTDAGSQHGSKAANTPRSSVLPPPLPPNPWIHVEAELQFGQSFSGGEMMELAAKRSKDLPLPATKVVVAQPSPSAELLCMAKPMFELVASGGGRNVPQAQIFSAIGRCCWAALIPDRDEFAHRMLGKFKAEEFKQGMELLRAGEPAPVIYVVQSGECVMKSRYVGLEEGSGVVTLMDLRTLREGDSCGDLSLASGRPLWYSLMVLSASVKVVAIDLAYLQSYFAQFLSPEQQAAVQHVVVQEDIKLYGTAVQHQANLLAQGSLQIEIFNPQMRALLKTVWEMGPFDMTELQRARGIQGPPPPPVQPQDSSASAGGKSAGSPTGNGAIAGKLPGGRTIPAAMAIPPICVEDANEANPVAELARRNHIAPTEAELQSANSWMRAMYDKKEFTRTMYDGSGIGRTGQGQLRIAMPTPSTEEDAFKLPALVRVPKQHDRKHVPKELQGIEVERARTSTDILPLSVLTSHQLADTLGLQLMMRPDRALQALPQAPAPVSQPPPPAPAALQQQQARPGGRGSGGSAALQALQATQSASVLAGTVPDLRPDMSSACSAITQRIGHPAKLSTLSVGLNLSLDVGGDEAGGPGSAAADGGQEHGEDSKGPQWPPGYMPRQHSMMPVPLSPGPYSPGPASVLSVIRPPSRQPVLPAGSPDPSALPAADDTTGAEDALFHALVDTIATEQQAARAAAAEWEETAAQRVAADRDMAGTPEDDDMATAFSTFMNMDPVEAAGGPAPVAPGGPLSTSGSSSQLQSRRERDQDRALWVRNDVYDPWGITHQFMSEMMTAALREAMAVDAAVSASADVAVAPRPPPANISVSLKNVHSPLAPLSQQSPRSLSRMLPPQPAPTGQQGYGANASSTAADGAATEAARMLPAATAATGGAAGPSGRPAGSSISGPAGRAFSTGGGATSSLFAPSAQDPHHPSSSADAVPVPSPLHLRMQKSPAAGATAATGRKLNALQHKRAAARVDQMQPGSSGVGSSGSSGPMPSGPTVDGTVLLEKDAMYVTMAQMRPKVLPEVTIAPHQQHAARQAATAAAAAAAATPFVARPVPGSASHTGSTGSAQDGTQKKGYVPAFLRSKRETLLPPQQLRVGTQSWAVPAFNSHVGFEAGFYDEDNEMTYFD